MPGKLGRLVLVAAAVLCAPDEVSGRISGGRYKITRKVAGSNSTPIEIGGEVVFLGAFGYSRRGRCIATVSGENYALSSGFFLEDVYTIQLARSKGSILTTDQFDVCSRSRNSSSEVRHVMQMSHVTGVTKKWRGELSVTEPGLYGLYFYNCQPANIKLTVSVQQFNLNGDKRVYLQVGDWPLPFMYSALFFVYGGMVAVWGVAMYRNHTHLNKVHFLMLALLVLKCGTVLFESLKYHAFSETGTGSTWDMFFYTFLMLKGVAFFLAILLIGSGWSFLKPFLVERDRRILAVVVPLQVVVNICAIIIDDTTEGDPSWSWYQDTLLVADVACCCIVLLPILWSVNGMVAVRKSNADGEVARNVTRLQQFRMFYLLVVGYIYFTRVCVPGIDSVVTYRFTFVSQLVQEVVTVCCYLFTGLKFRPMQKNPYLAVGEEEWQHMHPFKARDSDSSPDFSIGKPQVSSVKSSSPGMHAVIRSE